MNFTGQTIGNYKVVQQIGEGGMGVVYLAEHPVIGRKVAIKLLHTSFAKDSETVARFFNEARAIHMIAHPNIVEILDFGQTTDGQPYFIMEYLSGESLAERIARGPVLPQEAVSITTQICDALQAAHDKKIVHRDLKPHNVYLITSTAGGSGESRQLVKILDFGVAKMSTGWDAAQSGGQSVKTRTGSLMGTPLYMSPEQCRGSGKLDHRTDIYSLAVILFEMLSGRPPFMAEGVGELFAKHMLEPAPSLAEFAPQAPGHLVRAVARALSKDLDDRYPNMKAFRDALNGKEDAPAAPQPGGPRRVVAPSTASVPRTHRTVGSGGLPPEQTTLSSMVSELEGDIDAIPTRSRKGLLAGIAVAAFVVIGGVVALKKGRTPAAAPVASGTPVPGSSSATPPPVPPPATPAETPPVSTVNVRFEAEPATARVFYKSREKGEEEDLGPVPIELKLPRNGEPTGYVLRAENYKDRVVKLDLSRDQVVHLALERIPPAANRPKPVAAPKPARPKRPVIHDADGLAVPSF